METSSPGSPVTNVSVDELLRYVEKTLANDGMTFSGTWNYSVNEEGAVEFFFYNGLCKMTKEEFEELKQKSPDVTWKEYPNDWASDEIDDVIEYLKTNDLIPKPGMEFEEAVEQLKVLLASDPDEFSMGDNYPDWLQHVPGKEIETLARAVMKVLDHKEPNSPDEMVDKMLDDQ